MAAVIPSVQPMLPMPYRVQRVKRETSDTFTLELASANGQQPLPFGPGQFNMLYMFGVGEVAISISGNPETPETVIHTTRAVGAVTRALVDLKPGHVIGLRGPFGNSWPVDAAAGRDVVIVAGGIGLAPLRPLIYQLLQNRDQYRRIVLLYGTRTPDDILFRKEVEQWRSRFDMDVLITVDRSTPTWRGQVGVVTKLVAHAPFAPTNTAGFICGPEVMMTYAVDAMVTRGVAKPNIYCSMERNMKCAIGFCGHCQFGPKFICKDGPVFSYDVIEPMLAIREI